MNKRLAYVVGALACLGILAAQGAGLPVVDGTNTGWNNCSVALTLGGTAQNIISGQNVHGYLIQNIDASAGSGEPIWFSPSGVAVAAAVSSYPLPAPTTTTYANQNATSFVSPPGSGPNNLTLSVIAATTGHKINCAWW